VLNDFNWQQNLNGGRSGFIIGRYDPSDYLDVHGFSNPWTTFQNLSILFNPSIALPDTSVGLGFGHYFNDQWYGLATANDANGVLDDIGFFEDGFELYKSVELGWSPSRDQRYFKNAHVTAWHTDTRHNAGVPESWGVAATANWTFKEKWGPFARVGFSEGDAPLLNKSVTAGLIRYFEKRSDLFGLGVNWGEPAADSLRDQYTVEMFYRLQLAQNVAITPSVQFLIDPAGNPTESDTTVFGLRARFTF
jgi:porin